MNAKPAAAALALMLAAQIHAAPSGCPADGSGFVPAASPCLKTVGRALVAPADGSLGTPGALVFDWTGISAEARFTGTSLALEIGSTDVHLELCVDGACNRVHAAEAMKEIPVASGLKKGEHSFRLRKLSETIGGSVELGRFRLDAGAKLLPRAPRAAKRIEVIGDSYTVGYGVESAGREPGVQDASGRECDDTKLRASTNAFLAQGALAAERLGAEAQIDAFSGLGLVRAYNGSADFLNFPDYFGRTLQGKGQTVWNPAAPAFGDPWSPQAVVVALGTNDFSTELQPGESGIFADRAALRAAWKLRYREFLARLRVLFPGAKFVLVSTNLATGNELADGVREVAAEEAKAGRKDVSTVDLPSQTQFGCHWHPDLATQAANGKKLADAIAAATGWKPVKP